MERYDPDRHRRRSLRLRGYDYSQAGAYFVTICVQGRALLFGAVRDATMVLSDVGRIAEQEWLRTPLARPNVDLDAFVVMPDHLHAILLIERRADAALAAQPGALRSPSQTVGAIIRGFKAAVTQQIRAARRDPELVVWQRNYHERIIRDEDALNRIRQYIEENPAHWHERHNDIIH